MAFNSLLFGLFFALVCGVVVLLRRLFLAVGGASAAGRRPALRTRNAVLLVASYVFYGAWDPRFLSLILLSTMIDFVVGGALGRVEAPASRRRWLLVSLVTNLGLLGVFKYFDFFSRSFSELLLRAGLGHQPILVDVILPVGISFYTFQTLSYTIDVYRRRLEPATSLLDFALFVAFFPQLVAGPIERARDLLPQLGEDRPMTAERLERGLHLIGTGLFKKVVIADNVALVADAVFGMAAPTGLQTMAGLYAFAIQIYGDFSGYSDIARGTACCLGFDLSRNFDRPYFASTPSEFWQRWHISLSSWLRDYLYIPLGGNRHGEARTYRNLLVTMLLGGLWHGAAWTFVAWGLFHGVTLCAYRALEPKVRPFVARAGAGAPFLRGIGVLFYFQITALSWLLFRATSMEQAWTFLSSLWERPLGAVPVAIPGPEGALLAFGFLLLATQAWAVRRGEELPFFSLPPAARGAVYGVAGVVFALLGHDGTQPFIYFQF